MRSTAGGVRAGANGNYVSGRHTPIVLKLRRRRFRTPDEAALFDPIHHRCLGPSRWRRCSPEPREARRRRNLVVSGRRCR